MINAFKLQENFQSKKSVYIDISHICK